MTKRLLKTTKNTNHTQLIYLFTICFIIRFSFVVFALFEFVFLRSFVCVCVCVCVRAYLWTYVCVSLCVFCSLVFPENVITCIRLFTNSIDYIID